MYRQQQKVTIKSGRRILSTRVKGSKLEASEIQTTNLFGCTEGQETRKSKRRAEQQPTSNKTFIKGSLWQWERAWYSTKHEEGKLPVRKHQNNFYKKMDADTDNSCFLHTARNGCIWDERIKSLPDLMQLESEHNFEKFLTILFVRMQTLSPFEGWKQWYIEKKLKLGSVSFSIYSC